MLRTVTLGFRDPGGGLPGFRARADTLRCSCHRVIRRLCTNVWAAGARAAAAVVTGGSVPSLGAEVRGEAARGPHLRSQSDTRGIVVADKPRHPPLPEPGIHWQLTPPPQRDPDSWVPVQPTEEQARI